MSLRARMKATIEEYKERFMKRVEMVPECGCWIWMGGCQGPNLEYGSFLFEGTARRAHRISYLLFRGDPEKNDVLHTCDTPCCVNPDHLKLGTHKDNMVDMVKKGRHNPTHRNSKLKGRKGNVVDLYSSAPRRNYTKKNQTIL